MPNNSKHSNQDIPKDERGLGDSVTVGGSAWTMDVYLAVLAPPFVSCFADDDLELSTQISGGRHG